jgi:ferredoxin
VNSSFPITIDGRAVDVFHDETLLHAARRLGLDIPTLCYLEKCGPLTSCLVCLVKLKSGAGGKLVPSCGTVAQPGMVIESETDEVHEARKTALELLLSDHVGDCLSPCHRICPLRMNIPVMIRQIQENQFDQAIVTVREALPMPAVLGRLCHHPCENGCRRGTWDQPAAIRSMERFVADHDLAQAPPWLPPRHPSTGKSVVIVGSGPTGLAAAYFLAQRGHTCTVVDRHKEFGGTLRSQVDPLELPREVLDAELALLKRLGVQLKGGVELGRNVTLDGLQRGFDVVLLALGEHAKDIGKHLGVDTIPAGVKADGDTCQTSLPNVFAAGSGVKPVKQVVRAMAEGRAAAECIHQFLSGQRIRRADKPFSSMMGRLEVGEINGFMNGPSVAPRQSPCDACAGFNRHEAPAEAARCLHCDCRAVGHCALQRYAELYGADPNHFRQQRRKFEQHRQHGEIIFEPGKCILCGICVKLCESAAEPLGLTFIGRGFDVRVAAPFNRSIAEGLQKVGAECVEACPTGALTFKKADSESQRS